MTRAFQFLRRLVDRQDGTAMIETAIVAPVLVMMSIGTFEASAMVARQSELQSSAEQAVEIAMAVVPDTPSELTQVERTLETSSGLSDARVVLKFQYRCGSSTTVSDTAPSCSDDSLNTYISIVMTDEYQPVWTELGVSKSFEYRVARTVQIS